MEECLLRRVDVEGGSFAASPKSSRRLLEFSHNFSGQIPAGTAAYHTNVATFRLENTLVLVKVPFLLKIGSPF